ncbi:MAG: tRNA dihydrouridine synthase DusB [Candidatus Marinimicrobia bacterium]|nr:tRNA dihydrouridine synthase DusB [Candidatus Neomarinimicrobiota bacterium]
MFVGKVEIKSPIILAPMAGVTDYPFRVLCKKMGAGAVYSEFVSSEGIIRENQKTLDMIKFQEVERPIGVQIFGSNPNVMENAAKYVVDNFEPDILDINYGCPVPKITNKGGGSAALKDLCLMDDITQAVVEAVPNTPVTVKMRLGWNSDSIIIPEAGERLQNLGVKAITLHSRTTKQRYTGIAKWSYIRELKKSCSIPIIGNGDVRTTDDMMKMFEETGCDAVMIGRAAIGNPWFFREASLRLKGDISYTPPPLIDLVKTCQNHLNLLIENKGEKVGSNLMRKHFSSYIKGFPGASKYRKSLVTASTINIMKSELIKFKDYAQNLKN